MFLSHSFNCEVFSRRRHIFKKTRKFFFINQIITMKSQKKNLKRLSTFNIISFTLRKHFQVVEFAKKNEFPSLISNHSHSTLPSPPRSFSCLCWAYFLSLLFSLWKMTWLQEDIIKKKKMKIFFRLKCNFWKIFFFYLFFLSHTYTFTIFSIFKLHFS